ncbi:MAG: hypothetical protein ABFC94_05530 [Syntrophomonas sp.]
MAKQKITYDLIFRYALDRHGNRCNDSLNYAYVQHLVTDTMMSLIIRRGHLDELLISLGLCSLCKDRRDKGRVIR